MRNRFRIRTVIGYVAESMRYADTIEEAVAKAIEQEQKYPACEVAIHDLDEEAKYGRPRRRS